MSVMTSDNKRVAGAIAGKIKLDTYYCDLLPEDKVTARYHHCAWADTAF